MAPLVPVLSEAVPLIRFDPQESTMDDSKAKRMIRMCFDLFMVLGIIFVKLVWQMPDTTTQFSLIIARFRLSQRFVRLNFNRKFALS